MTDRRSLRSRTAGALKWNVIDKIATQVLYAVTGLVLAWKLSQEDFGLVTAVLVFQAFASLLVNSGFSYALLQKQRPTRLEYSTVLWFNMGMALILYAVLWLGAPLIADWFGGDRRIVPLARVMFLCLILNAAIIVQTNRQMKAMDVRAVAASNFIGLLSGGIAGIWLACTGAGAWAIVWQNVVMGVAKAVVLWTASRWRPLWRFSWAALRGFAGIGSRMLFTSFLNTVFLNIYSFFIGNRVGLVPLGYYGQADKWSKMGVNAIQQILASTFVPTLSAVQDDAGRFARLCSKMNRFTAYIVFPAIGGLVLVAEPLFHALFGTKWDASIVLFRLLLGVGVFTVLNSLYSNYLLALGRARAIMWLEVVRDVAALAALAVSFPYMALTTPTNIVWGVELLLWGQMGASALTWMCSVVVTSRTTGCTVWRYLADLAPYAALTAAVMVPAWYAGTFVGSPWLKLGIELVLGAGAYMGINALLGSNIQRQVLAELVKKKK